MSAIGVSTRFDLGNAVTLTIAVIRKNILQLMAVSFLFYTVPAVVIALMRRMIPVHAGRTPMFPFQVYTNASWLPASLLLSLAGIFFGAILQAVVIDLVVGDLSGRAFDLAGSTRRTLRLCLPLFAVLVVVTLVSYLGLILLVVPGVLVWLAWCVAVPVVVVEQAGPAKALRRSVALTRNHRGAIFGAFFVVFLVQVIAAVIIVTILNGLLGVGFMAMWTLGGLTDPHTLPRRLAATAVGNTLTGSWVAAAAAVIYFQLRGGKDGVGFEQVADVFS